MSDAATNRCATGCDAWRMRWLVVVTFFAMTSSMHLCAQESGRARSFEPQPAKEPQKASPPGIFYTQVPERAFDVILCRPTDTSVTVSVVAYTPLVGHLEYGLTEAALDSRTASQEFMPEQAQTFLLAGLAPNARYHYRFVGTRPNGQTSVSANVGTFQTQRFPGADFTFTVQADSHLDTPESGLLYERVLRAVAADAPDFHIDLGDTFMTDKRGGTYMNARPQYFAQRYYFGLVCHSAPLFLVLGNHDGESSRRFDGTTGSMAGWSYGMRTSLFPNPVPDSFYTGNAYVMEPLGNLQDYYAWKWGNAQFIVLDPYWFSQDRGWRNADPWMRSLGENQYSWLRDTLEQCDSAFVFVFIHNLVGGLDGSMRGGAEAATLFEWGGRDVDEEWRFSDHRLGWVDPIHKLLRRHGVAVVFHGHDHFFAHQELDGIVYQLVPQPSHPKARDINAFAREYGYLTGDFLPGPGYLRVTVGSGIAKVAYASFAGARNVEGTNEAPRIAYEYDLRAREVQQ